MADVISELEALEKQVTPDHVDLRYSHKLTPEVRQQFIDAFTSSLDGSLGENPDNPFWWIDFVRDGETLTLAYFGNGPTSGINAEYYLRMRNALPALLKVARQAKRVVSGCSYTGYYGQMGIEPGKCKCGHCELRAALTELESLGTEVKQTLPASGTSKE